jgi:hypothetical protein
MILNLSKIKTEALLLFCKDIIVTYKDSEEIAFDVDKELIEFINSVSENILKEINRAVRSHQFYMSNSNNSRIKAVILSYEFLNKEISQILKEDNKFNPSMLYFSLLAMWFKELNKESKSKEFIFFTIYTYGEVYDRLLLKQKDVEFRRLNIKMIEIAEKIILKFDNYKFR